MSEPLVTYGGLLFMASISLYVVISINKRSRRYSKIPSVSHITSSIGTIEVCLSDIDSAMTAVNAGANSIELCSDRSGGGVTPSMGLILQCVDRLRGAADVHVLIRPRVGDFIYSAEEFSVIVNDIKFAKECGADGIVIGVLTAEGGVDIELLKQIRQVSKGMMLTFHRAIDICPDYLDALEILIECGCDRILTSGQQSTALRGLPNLSKIVCKAQGRIDVVAAAGVSADNADIIISGTGVQGVHAGSAVMTSASHRYNNDNNGPTKHSTATMGTGSKTAAEDLAWDAVDGIKVARYVNSATEGFSTYHRNSTLLPVPLLSVDIDTGIDVYPAYSAT